MQNVVQQIKDDVAKIKGDKNTLAAIGEAMSDDADYATKFHANWMIARGFYNLGFCTDWKHAPDRADARVRLDADDLGCKMAYIDKDKEECIIIPGKQGYVQMNAKGHVGLYGGYHTSHLDVMMALDGVSLKQTFRELMVQGLPFMGLIPILDMIVEKNADREEMVRLHAKFRSYLA